MKNYNLLFDVLIDETDNEINSLQSFFKLS